MIVDSSGDDNSSRLESEQNNRKKKKIKGEYIYSQDSFNSY